jgi:aspartyl-tRNA(Asn)/glutamyl-tRNA(Gln) amidotransferase subunit C
MKISRDEVLRVAGLAHLELSPEEAETYQSQLDAILTYIDKLKELDVANVEPMAQGLFKASVDGSQSHTDAYAQPGHTQSDGDTAELHPELRDDIPVPCAIAKAVLSQAPDAAEPFFRVPKVIER